MAPRVGGSHENGVLMEAIILAGGLGTRLKDTVPDLPKPLAPIAGRPFLCFLLDTLARQGITRAILSVGYCHEAIVAAIGSRHGNMEIAYCIEDCPLGTGGGLRKALSQAADTAAFVMNGDTYFAVDLQRMLLRHRQSATMLTVALRQVPDTERYGRVEQTAGYITHFKEKGIPGAGMINGGIYLADRALFDGFDLPDVFSFEQDFLLPHLLTINPAAFVSDAYFIDIGIPEDYRRAVRELPQLR